MNILTQVTDRVFAHTEGKTIGNVGVIAADHGNYIIDTSMFPIIARDIKREIESIGSGKLLGAILTHYHLDHTAGNQFFHPHIYAHIHVLENMRNNYKQEDIMNSIEQREDKHLFEGLTLTYPTKTFETNPYSPDDSDTIEVYRFGGHTNGSSLIYYKEESTIFAGDDLFAGLYPWGGDPTASPYDWLGATEFMLDKKPDIIIPGHGDIQHTLKEVELLKRYLLQIIEIGERLIQEKNDKDVVMEALMGIDANPEKNPEMKERTLQHWYKVIKNTVNPYST